MWLYIQSHAYSHSLPRGSTITSSEPRLPYNVTVTVQWEYPEFDGGVSVNNYTISGTNIMMTTSQINETTLSLPYNARQTIEVAAANCIGTSGTIMLTYFDGSVYGSIYT